MINVFLSKSLFYNRFSWGSMLEMSKFLTDPSLTSLNLQASFFINQSPMFIIIQDFMQALLVSQGLLYYQKHWKSIHLSLHWTWVWVILFHHSFFISFVNSLGDKEIALISAALEVNSSLLKLNLDMVGKFDWIVFLFSFYCKQNWWCRGNIIIINVEG